MMSIMVKTIYRVECDCCGLSAPASSESPKDARDIAEKGGFQISNWLDKGSSGLPRQTIFCPQCVRDILQQKAIEAITIPNPVVENP